MLDLDVIMDAIKDLNLDVVILVRSFYLLVAAGVPTFALFPAAARLALVIRCESSMLLPTVLRSPRLCAGPSREHPTEVDDRAHRIALHE